MTNLKPSPNAYLDKSSGLWHARIYHRYKYIHVGRYTSEEQALKMANHKIAEMAQETQPAEKVWAGVANASLSAIVAKDKGKR